MCPDRRHTAAEHGGRRSLRDGLDGKPLRAGEVADVRRRDGTKQVVLERQPVSIMGADRLSGAGQDGGKARGSQTTEATSTDGLPTPALKEKKKKITIQRAM